MGVTVAHMSNWTPSQFASRIEAARKDAALTKLQLSDSSGIAYSTLNRKLVYSPESFTLQDTAKIAAALGVTVESLLVAA
jgi:hypothetical protein